MITNEEMDATGEILNTGGPVSVEDGSVCSVTCDQKTKATHVLWPWQVFTPSGNSERANEAD